MKEIITNYWKKILISIGAVLIIINSFIKIFAKKVLLSDIIKFGKNIESTSNGMAGLSTMETPFDSGMLKLMIILMVGIFAVVIITTIASKSSADAKKK